MPEMSDDELDFQRLLDRTKKLSREDLAGNIYKVAAAVNVLEGIYSKLQDDRKLDPDVLMQYGREAHQLRQLVDVEQKKSPAEKLRALDQIPTTFPASPPLESDEEARNEDEPKRRAEIAESSAGLRARTRAIYQADLRKQLLGAMQEEETRTEQQHEAEQEQFAVELLNVTRALKENVSLARKVVQQDNERLVVMEKQADANRTKLEIEGKRLAHHAYKCGFDCALVVVAILLLWSFLAMVLVMKVFPKSAVK